MNLSETERIFRVYARCKIRVTKQISPILFNVKL